MDIVLTRTNKVVIDTNVPTYSPRYLPDPWGLDI